MADKNAALADNVAGKFYVDDTCIGCGLCTTTAPENFALSGDKAYVSKQPETPEEDAAATDALEACPVQAIGNDR